MPMRVHELHPILIHAPLVLLPAATTVDVLAATSSRRLRRAAFSAVGRRLWWGAAASGLAAGLAGMAASQEVDADDQARDMMLVHGLGNVLLVAGAFGLATWRMRHRATLLSAGLGAGALIASTYTAWLGGEMVYGHGVGVKAHTADADLRRSPPLLSRHAPLALAGDALKGLGWLLRRAADTIAGKDVVRFSAVSPTREAPTEGTAPLMH
jgi:uncharacterized membrane protein